MAEIYLARVAGAEGFSKLVVVKRLLDKLAGDPEFVQMFLDEARINARLSHSNIVQVLELGEVDGQYFMAMEYVSGLSVAQVGRLATQRLGEVPQGVACGIVAQSCAGLHHAHETKLPDGSMMSIIHRDVSPQNLLLTYEGYVKVVDFGIAKAEGRATQTRAGLVKGKFAYMSPEQCLGEDIDRRTDIFALGIVLFELCTARRLFKRASTYETYDAIVRCDIPAPSSVSAAVPAGVEAVILKALAKRKEDRFDTAEAMQEALEYAMRRGGIRGSALDLSRFLEHNFAAEITEQEQLLRRVESGELASPEHQGDVENSQLAKAFKEKEGGDEQATVVAERSSADRPNAAGPPAVPASLRIALPSPMMMPQDQLAMIPNRPVSMAMPIVSTGPPPRAPIGPLRVTPSVPSAGVKAADSAPGRSVKAADSAPGRGSSSAASSSHPGARGSTPAVPQAGPGMETIVGGQANDPQSWGQTGQKEPGQEGPPQGQSGQGMAPQGQSGQGMAPQGIQGMSVQGMALPGQGMAPQGVESWLVKLANLPMPYLIASAVFLAVLAALLTSLFL